MSDRQGTHYLTVTGVGSVQVEPDEAVVQLGVVTEAGTAAEAVASNARQTQAVLDAVSAQPNHGITTSGLSVSPIINYEPNSSVSKIVGFRATNSVEVTTKIGYVGQIYDAGITAGANESSGITFRVRDEGPQRKEALRLAVEQAFDEAKLVAAAADIDLRGVDSIQVDPPRAASSSAPRRSPRARARRSSRGARPSPRGCRSSSTPGATSRSSPARWSATRSSSPRRAGPAPRSLARSPRRGARPARVRRYLAIRR